MKIRYRNASGKLIKCTPRQYLSRVMRTDRPCASGHFGCAAVEGGPCGAAVQADYYTKEEA